MTEVMKQLYIQLQPDRCEIEDPTHFVDALVCAAEAQRDTEKATVVSGFDDGRYTNVMVTSQSVTELWTVLRPLIVDDSVLALCTMVCSEGDFGWDDYLLLYHFDNSVQLDEFPNLSK